MSSGKEGDERYPQAVFQNAGGVIYVGAGTDGKIKRIAYSILDYFKQHLAQLLSVIGFGGHAPEAEDL